MARPAAIQDVHAHAGDAYTYGGQSVALTRERASPGNTGRCADGAYSTWRTSRTEVHRLASEPCSSAQLDRAATPLARLLVPSAVRTDSCIRYQFGDASGSRRASVSSRTVRVCVADRVAPVERIRLPREARLGLCGNRASGSGRRAWCCPLQWRRLRGFRGIRSGARMRLSTARRYGVILQASPTAPICPAC
jgi:hypothetical protein